MQDQIDGLMKHIKAQTPATVEELVQNTDSPFTSEIEEADNSVSITAYIAGLYSRQFLYLLSQEPPKTLTEFMLRAQKHMNTEEAVYARRSHDSFDPHAGPSQPGKLRTDPNRRTKDKYCRFHRDHGHNTDDCIDLKQQIEELIQRGRLQHFVTKKYQKISMRDDTNKQGKDATAPRSGPIGEIKVIHGGLAGGGESSNARKAHLRKLRTEEYLEVNTVGRPSKFQKKEEIPIIFSEEDIKGIQVPHDDPLVITIVMADYLTRRVLIDSGSSVDILYLHAYDQLKVGQERLRPLTSPLVGFAAYNAILGRTTLNKIRAIISTYHLMMKFPTPEGIGCIKGDQKAARECYVTSLKGTNITMSIESLDTRDAEKLQHGEPVEKLLEELLEPDLQGRTVRIGSGLSTEAKAELLQFLRDNKDVFAWSHEGIPKIDPRVLSHKLNVDPTILPVRQKTRTFAPKRNEVAANEVDKLVQVGSIREVLYPDWLANVVMVKKASAGHELLSFMDAFSRYNQIQMHEEDKEKTSFITDRGLYCYKVIPFGLKNVGATYQRLVNKMFKQQIGRNVEVYVDDMLVKSAKARDHVTDLKEIFQVLRKYQMRLNSTKCAFGIFSGKFLGFMVSQRGIEANPEKIQAILTMSSPQNIKEVQKLTGRVAALSRTQDEEDLYLYLAVSPHAVSAVLIREEQGTQLPIYYTSRALRGAELRYPKAEKIAFAMVIAARRLRPYFQAHSIKVLTDQPLRRILHCPETSGRLIQWSIELGKFDIEYKPWIAVKAQVLAGFLAEYTYPEPEELPKEELKLWVLQVDGSTTKKASGAGLILTSPKGQRLSYTLRFKFQATNNEPKYKALVVGLELAKAVDANHVLAKSDSQLVVGQVLGEYVVKEEVVQKYLDKVKSQIARLQSFNIIRIPREENTEADYLSKLATAKEDAIPRNAPIRYLELPCIFALGIRVQAIDYSNSWMSPIVEYIKNGALPND
ncbi:uncharacterized protein LOC131323822 [Rhododendron vialii]|uniref:uncharacterized protein LOC131323822 n=1 Tax=Rhododendron vialii TaxID=182163 RepID=UPI0026603389|nr:uncharacterized protein LOC131323822 [Rhododendron vialii]